MITEEEYNKACKINDDEDEELEREMEEYSTALNCTCGAWQIHKGRAHHIADCVCGAE